MPWQVIPCRTMSMLPEPKPSFTNGVRATHDDDGRRIVIVLSMLFLVPGALGAVTSLIIADGTDTALLLGLLGSLVAPSCYLLACGMGSIIAGFLRK
jgi:hypothetical protein